MKHRKVHTKLGTGGGRAERERGGGEREMGWGWGVDGYPLKDRDRHATGTDARVTG